MVRTTLTYEVEYPDGRITTTKVEDNAWDWNTEHLYYKLQQLLTGAGWDQEQVEAMLGMKEE